MGIIRLIGQFFKIAGFFLDLYKEKNKKKAEEKKKVADEITESFKETNPKLRAAKLNNAVQSINRLRK